MLDSEKEAIRDALSHSLEKHEESSSDQDLAERIKSKKPTLMFVTSDERAGHKIGLVFNNGKLFVCNRGAGGKRSGIKIYSYDEACITPGLISKLKGFRRLTELQEIIQGLHPRRIGTIHQKPQTVGNVSLPAPNPLSWLLCILLLKIAFQIQQLVLSSLDMCTKSLPRFVECKV